MNMREVIGKVEQLLVALRTMHAVGEAEIDETANGIQKPLTPEQSRARAKKQATANAKLSDVRAKASIDVRAAVRKASEVR